MAFAFLPDDPSVEAALRRIGREEATGALGALSREGPLGPRVHEMRRAVKKLRGLLRLVRPVMRGAAAENAALRDMGRGLSALRDAAVRRATLEGLAGDMEEGRREALLLPFREAEAQADERAAEAQLPAFAAAMEALRDRSAAWALRRDGWQALSPGLEATWDAARAALKVARRDGGDDDWHEWRKRTKDHWYQARLLQPIWPEMMAPHVAGADHLGELLGLAGDLAVLRDALEVPDLPPDLRAEARGLAEAARAARLAEAVPLGAKLLAGPARGIVRRWGAWWRLSRPG